MRCSKVFRDGLRGWGATLLGLCALAWFAGCGATGADPAASADAGRSPEAARSPEANNAPSTTLVSHAAESSGDSDAEPTAGSAIPTALAANAPKAASGGAETWSSFRGPTGMGLSSAKGVPVEWSGEENIAWKTKMPGPGASSPIVWGDRIYITCYTGFFIPDEPGGSQEDLRRHLIALSRDDGQIIWDKPVAAKLPEEERIRDHGFAASTPAADADHVYVFYGKSGVIAFTHDGQQVWQADVGSRTHGWGSAASPVLYKDLVIINASVESDSLYALDRRTGETKWRATGIREAWNTPVIVESSSGRKELIVATQGKVLAFNPDSGDSLWSCKTDIGWYMVPSVVASEGVVYCLGGRSGTAALAVRCGGEGEVTDSHRLWTSIKGSNVSSPVVSGEHLYWMHEQRGIAYCAKLATGDIVYEERLQRANQTYASAVLADGKLYYLCRDGRTFVIAAKPTFEQLAVNDFGDRSMFNASPVVDGQRLLIRSDKYLYCVGK